MTANILDPSINLTHPDLQPATALPDANTPAAPATTTNAAAQKKWAGKYESPEALEQGYQNSAKEVQNILAREKAKDQELASLKLQLQGRVNPADVAAARRNPMDELNEAMVPVEALGLFVQQEIAKAFEPVARSMEARSAVSKEYKEFGTLEENLNEYLTANPEINNRYQKTLRDDPQTAMEWLFLRYQRDNPTAQPDLSGQDQATARAVGALGSSGVGPRNTEVPLTERLNKATERYQQTGDIIPALQIALVDSGFIDPSHLK